MTVAENRAAWLETELTRVDGQSPRDTGQAPLGKHLKMAGNPFVFLRGAAQLFYADIQAGYLQLPEALYTLPKTRIMGDCHTSNFGFFTEEGSHGDRVVFAPNDFDDACVGHAVWDMARFAVSLVLCADYCRGLSKGEFPQVPGEKDYAGKARVKADAAEKAIHRFLAGYQQRCDMLITSPDYHQQVVTDFPDDHILSKPFAKARARASGGADFLIKSSLAKAVDVDAAMLRFRDRADKFQRLNTDTYQQLEQAFAPYMDDAVLDIVARLDAGTGSVNMGRYYLLVGPADYQGQQDLNLCHIVEVKQQRKAAPLFYFDDLSPVNRLNPAHLTLECQRRMQRFPDLVLDEAEYDGQHWLVRSRHHAKVGLDPENVALGKKARKGGFEEYAFTCGHALALAHGRGDRRSVRFEQAVAEVLPAHTEAFVQACLEYAQLVREDWALLNQMLGREV